MSPTLSQMIHCGPHLPIIPVQLMRGLVLADQNAVLCGKVYFAECKHQGITLKQERIRKGG